MASPFVRHQEAEPIADVNVVPLADVSLVLLIILLVLSPMASQSMLRVHAAAARAAAKAPEPLEDPLNPTPPPPALTLELTPQGYVAGGRLLSDAQLCPWLQGELAGRPKEEDRKAFLAPELDVTHGRVVSAIEAIQACGAPSVALVQVADDQPPAAPEPR